MYTFSFWVRAKMPVIVRRPWWKIFGKDRIEYVSCWTKVAVEELSEEAKNLILDSNPSVFYEIILPITKQLIDGDSLLYIQLEEGPANSQYIKTNADPL